MTYPTTSENFAARTTARGMSTALVMAARTGLSHLSTFLKSIGESFLRAGEASSRIHRVEALRAKTDAELAAIGIKRDDIVHHVFKDLYYI